MRVNFISRRYFPPETISILEDFICLLCNKKGHVAQSLFRNTLLECSIISKASAKGHLSGSHYTLSNSKLGPIQHTTSRAEISQSWPEGLFQCSRVLGSRPRVMMSAHCIEVINSIIHRPASFWIDILMKRSGVYSTPPAKTIQCICCTALDQ